MARDPSTRICSMVQTLDEGDGVKVFVETHDEKQAFVFSLDGDESAAFQRTLAFDRDAVVLGLRETIAGTRARAERAESALAAECTKSAAGLKAIEAAQAGIERLTRERTTAEALAARRGDALATEKLNHDQTKQKAIDLGNSNHNLRDLCEQLEKRAESAEARVKVLEGDAVPVRWAVVANGVAKDSFRDKTVAQERLDAYPEGSTVEPLYRHPPKPSPDLVAAAEATRERLLTLGRITEDERDHFADMLARALGKPSRPIAPKPAGEPVAWRVDCGCSGNLFAQEQEAYVMAKQHGHADSVVPLYEAPPPAAMAVDVSSIRQLIEHGKQGCFDMSSFLIVLGNMLGELPTVDVERLRTLAKTVLGGDSVHHVSEEILAAIGEKA